MNRTRLSELEAFLAVAETGGFGTAARDLGLTQPSISRKIAALEARLGIGLVTRTTRTVALTQAGAAFADEVRGLVSGLRDAEARVVGGDEAVAGLVRMTMPTAFGRKIVMPILASLVSRHPDLRFDLDLSDRYVELSSSVDIAIRFSSEAPSGWQCRQIGQSAGRLCAAAHYLDATPPLRSIDDLAAHRLLVARTYTPRTTWTFGNGKRKQVMEITPTVIASDFMALAELAVAGAGIAALPSFLADPEIKAGRLVELLPGQLLAHGRSHACVRHDQATLPRVRVTLDALADGCAPLAM